jgi:nitroreductase
VEEAITMEFADVVHKRRMVRHFTGAPVPIETIERIIRLAQHAPSAGFSQGVTFVVVTDAATRQRTAALVDEAGYVGLGQHPFISEAPVQVLLCTSEQTYVERYREPDKRPDPDAEDEPWPIPYWHIDAGCAMMLVLLAAVAEGLSAGFVATWDQQGFRDLLGIPENVLPVGLILLGYGAPDVPSTSLQRGRRPLDVVLHRERW